MESPVVLDKPPEYHGSDVNRGFPFEDEEGSGAWSELAARHPDIAARLRQRPASATWARKRRPSSQDATEENFGNFDRFPFDDIPPEFREHFPSHWNRGFGSREEGAPPPPPPAAAGSPPHHASTATATAGTQTERTQPEPAPSDADTDHLQSPLPQYGLRNTVDLGQKSPADPSLVDADDRTHRSMSAPPSARPPPDMSSQRPEPPPHQDPPSKVRVIPIHVEGRDEPAMPRAETKPQHAPHVDRAQYFTEEPAPSYHHPTYFSRAFDTPGTKAFRQGSQPFTQQKAYPQAASFTRGTSPQRAPQPRPPPDEHFVKVPVQHEHASPSPAAPPAPAPAPREHTPPPKPTPTDPITQILSIQTDVLNLMNEVENFAGCKKDKRYLFLDEMLTRNLIKLDNIETEGKENIRLARREAIKCIQKCIAVLEAKAEKNGKPKETNVGDTKEPDVDMKEVQEDGPTPATENGEVEMKEEPLPQAEQVESHKASEETAEAPLQAEPTPPASVASLPDPNPTELKPEEQNVEVQDKPSPKKKVVKKRDKSKDKAPANSVEAAKDSIIADANVEVMKVDNKGDKTEQVMDVDGAASQ